MSDGIAVRIGIVGDYDPSFPPHRATDEAITHAADRIRRDVDAAWVATMSLEQGGAGVLERFDGLWIAPGSPYRSLDGALRAIRFARERGRPLIATCGGLQHVVIEYARNVLGFRDAAHAEYDPSASTLFITRLSCSLAGKRLEMELREGSRAIGIYGKKHVAEQYYCNFGLNPLHQDQLHEGGLRVTAVDADGEARILELPSHPFYLATLFVPQLRSSSDEPHPLIVATLEAAARYHES